MSKSYNNFKGGFIMEKYRFDQYGTVYQYDADEKIYFFVGCLNGRTKKEFIKDLEELRMMNGEE